jgi:hypothetical protein
MMLALRMRQLAFRSAFVVGPFLIFSIIPSIIFGFLLNQWGTNVVWGSVFGIGWCVSALATGGLFNNSFAMAVGLLWVLSILIALFLTSGWLWRNLDDHGRVIALMILALTFLPNVPAKTIMGWDANHFHLPDFTLHMAESY